MDYDPMLSKLIAYAPTREMAIARLLRALDEYVIGGIRSNLGLFRRILRDEDFRRAAIDTGYLDRLLAAGPVATTEREPAVELAAALGAALLETTRGAGGTGGGPAGGDQPRAWKLAARREAMR